MGKRGRQTKSQKDNSPSTHGAPDPKLQPVVVARQVDPATEQKRLENAAKRRYKLAAQLLLMKDLSPMLVTVTETAKNTATAEHPLDLTTSQHNSSTDKGDTSSKPTETAPNPATTQGSKDVQKTKNGSKASNGGAAVPTPATTQGRKDVQKTKNGSKASNGGAAIPTPSSTSSEQASTSAEAAAKPREDAALNQSSQPHIDQLPAIPDLNSTPEGEVVIGSAIVYDGQDTKTLRKDIKKIKSQHEPYLQAFLRGTQGMC